MNKNEDKIKDVEPITLGMDTFSEDFFYSEEMNTTTVKFISLKAVYEKRAEKLKLKNDRYKDNTDMRKALVVAFTTIIAFWLLAVILILVGNRVNKYDLSENTLIAFLTTSSANVLGMMYVIFKNLFPEKNKDKKKENTTDK